MKFREYRKIIIALCLSMFFISFVLLDNIRLVQSYTIDDYGTVYANQTATGRNFHINSIVQLPNGDLFAVHQNTSVHSGYDGYATVERSTDNGTTWSTDGNIYYPCGGALAHVMPDGSIMVTLKTSGGVMYMLSYDNGSTFTSAVWLSGVVNNDWNVIAPARYDESTGNMFLPVYESDIPIENFVYNSTDNGATWSYYSTIASGLQGHYTNILQVANGSWTCIIHSSYQTLTYQVWSEDDCKTWGTPINISAIANIRDPQLAMGSITGNINPYVLFGRDRSNDDNMYIYNSSDCVNWGNAHLIDIVTDPSAYSWGVNMKNNDFIISYSKLVINPWAELKYIKLFDFGDPPYNIRPWEPVADDTIQFISIEGDTNGTTIYTSTPTFNWTLIAGASQYHLQIANDSAFAELIVNISDINEHNYPSEYDGNETRVSFTLPTSNFLDVYKTYYCRVKVYT